MFLRFIPLIIASLLLGAHFLRSGNMVLVGVCVLTPLLLLIRKRRILLLVQWLAYFGALVWAHTAFILIRHRMMTETPWGRMLLILSCVILFTLYAGYLLNSDVVKKCYK